MTSLRRSLLFSFGQRYSMGVLSIVSMAVLARLLSPEEMGIFMVAASLITMTEVLRDFGVSTYLVQRKEMTLAGAQAAFTLTLLLSGLLAAAVLVASGAIARFYGEPGLQPVLRLAALNFLLLPFCSTSMALLRREMAFDAIARINLVAGAAYYLAVNGLAALGFSYMSLAWATLINLAATTALSALRQGDLRVFRPNLAELRSVLFFGGVASGTAILNILYANLPPLILGRILGFGPVGLYNRATMVVHLFDRLVLDGLNPVTLPALVRMVERGEDLKAPYLRALSYITGLQWPFLLCLALLAYPAVEIMLGQQWLAVAPLVQIAALPTMLIFPAFLTYPLLVAMNRIADTLTMSLITVPASILIMTGAAFFGLTFVALSLFLIAPLQVGIALIFVRRQIHFTWPEMARSLRGSGLAAICAAAAPAAIVLLSGGRFDMPMPQALVAGTGALAGWIAGLSLARHPLLRELEGAAAKARQLVGGIRPRHRRTGPLPGPAAGEHGGTRSAPFATPREP
jgi:O-antigen/teichoic acid export membrane protein